MDKVTFIQKYAERIDIDTDSSTNLDTLRKIHRQHLLNIPFENLDIINKKRIEFDTEKLKTKILDHNRGGICYELNGLLLHLLTSIGFEAYYIAANVMEDGDDFDHVLIAVSIDSDRWLVDVGFGDNFLEPIKLEEDVVQKDLKGDFKITKMAGDRYQLLRSMDEINYSVEYTFTLKPRKLEDFRERCIFFETSPASRFAKKSICSLEKEKGRISLQEDRVIITEHGERVEKKVRDEIEFKDYLKQLFKINDIIGETV